MLPDLPVYVSLIFILTTILSVWLFYRILKNASPTVFKPNIVTGVILVWLMLQGIVAYSLFYTKELNAFPPRFLLVITPVLIVIFILFSTEKGRKFLDSLPLLHLTWLSIVRIPVEIGLYWLAVGKAIPELMTFAGSNFDIIGGLTAPFVAYFGIQKGKIGRNALLVWNIAMMGLLLFIIQLAILSAPTPMQQYAFEQPNIAVINFPYVWLAAFIAPAVLFSHLVSIRQLMGHPN